jgi:hypothetical protein
LGGVLLVLLNVQTIASPLPRLTPFVTLRPLPLR